MRRGGSWWINLKLLWFPAFARAVLGCKRQEGPSVNVTDVAGLGVGVASALRLLPTR